MKLDEMSVMSAIDSRVGSTSMADIGLLSEWLAKSSIRTDVLVYLSVWLGERNEQLHAAQEPVPLKLLYFRRLLRLALAKRGRAVAEAP